jgi:Zn-dependent peptidase ImmA (M78 family)
VEVAATIAGGQRTKVQVSGLRGAEDIERVITRARKLVDAAEITTLPVNIARLARLSGVERIEIRSGMGASGQLRREGQHLIIELDSHEPIERRNFTCCHEIGHTFMLDDSSSKFRDLAASPSCTRYTREEYLCDRAAAELLMPEKLFRPAAAALHPSIASVIQLARLFQSSIRATIVRLGQIAEWPAVFLVWRFSSRWGSSAKLRVSWSVKPEGSRCFIPRHVPADPKSGIYAAFVSAQITAETETLRLGSLRGGYRTENKRFGDYVVSIVHDPHLRR